MTEHAPTQLDETTEINGSNGVTHGLDRGITHDPSESPEPQRLGPSQSSAEDRADYVARLIAHRAPEATDADLAQIRAMFQPETEANLPIAPTDADGGTTANLRSNTGEDGGESANLRSNTGADREMSNLTSNAPPTVMIGPELAEKLYTVIELLAARIEAVEARQGGRPVH
jgi:hypothetical protein